MAAKYERRFRHDVMAHVHAFGDQAPAARPFIHLGATSAFVADNADLIVMRDAMRLILGRLIAVVDALEVFAVRTKDIPCLAYTHFQPAQLTTVGKRATLWMQDLAIDIEEVCRRLETLRLRGCKGTTGTQASFLELFKGDHAKVREVDTRVAARMGFSRVFPVTGQTYTRKADSQIVDCLSGVAQSGSEDGQRSPAAPARGRAARAVRVGADRLQRDGLQAEPDAGRADQRPGPVRDLAAGQHRSDTAATQWLERTLDDSANRRLACPRRFSRPTPSWFSPRTSPGDSKCGRK